MPADNECLSVANITWGESDGPKPLPLIIPATDAPIFIFCACAEPIHRQKKNATSRYHILELRRICCPGSLADIPACTTFIKLILRFQVLNFIEEIGRAH